MKTYYVEKDQNMVEETTRYWFNAEFENSEDDGMYAVAESGSETTYLDCDGCEVDQRLVPDLEKNLIVTEEMRNDY